MRDEEKERDLDVGHAASPGPGQPREALAFSSEIEQTASERGDDWPKALRVLRVLCPIGLAFATVQLFHFIVNRGELGPPITFQGFYALASYPLTVVATVSGLRWQKRRFVLILFAACVLHVLVTGFFVLSMLTGWRDEHSTTGLAMQAIVARDVPYLVWNLCVGSVALVLLRYLLSKHIRVAGRAESG